MTDGWLDSWRGRLSRPTATTAQATLGGFGEGGLRFIAVTQRGLGHLGAIALGRNDLPVVPAVGVIYQPNDALRWELLFPKPRLAFLLVDNGPRQQWGYIGAGINGSTWGIERSNGTDDQLTYGDGRFVLGWESTPTPEPGLPFTRGRKMIAEIGYAFSRDFEFEHDMTKIRLDDTLMVHVALSF